MMISLEELVPKDHSVRKVDKINDFTVIYPSVEPTYLTLGRPSIDPAVLVKIVFIQYLFGIRSMRQILDLHYLLHSKQEKTPKICRCFYMVSIMSCLL